ncbi:MAG: SDR family oxidoreductase [Hyphomicrobium aestuarii]|nr:SDR family oxidoreductase [Hyphomicrobium aestuarii]
MSKIALVTGAGSGIGKVSALALAADGWTVVLSGRRRETLAQTAALASTANVSVVPADVTDEAAVSALFAAIERDHGRLDLLFNNAGAFGPGKPLDEVTGEEWRATVDANLNGAFYCAREAIRLMKRQRPIGGRIINNGSISAQVPRPNGGTYATTKHAITGLTKSISLEGRAFDIACGQIDIGNAATDMTAGFGAGALQADGTRKQEPRMDVAHVATAIVQMANLPLSANVQFMTIMATAMPYVGRG